MPNQHSIPTTAVFDPDAVRQWLHLLHGNPAGLTHICSVGDWTGQVFADLEAAARHVTYLNGQGREGIYARVTTLRAALAPGRRGGTADTAALPALWADIDLAGPGHQHDPTGHGGRILPPDEAAGRRLVATSGLPEPTVWIHSGGGLYALWFLHRSAELAEQPELLDQVKGLSTGWQVVLEAAAAGHGWHYGRGVGDLARVLRIPGTVNRKAGLARPCRLLSAHGPRYTLDQLQAAHDLARPAPAPVPAPPARALPPPTAPAGPARRNDDDPGEDLNRRATWQQILEPAGWRTHYQAGQVTHWTRPGKPSGTSATTNALGTDRLHIFTTNAPPLAAGESYHKFATWTLLYHAGDYRTAAAELARQGYGAPLTRNHDDLVALLGHDPDATLTTPPTPTNPAPTRPRLDVTNTALAADWLRNQLGRGPLAGMLDRGGHIVHTPAEGEDGYQPTSTDQRDHDGPAQIRTVTASTLASRITWTWTCHRTLADGTTRPAMFPTSAARVPVDVPDMLPHLRHLAGVTHTPLVRPDGTLLTTPGYDPTTRLLHLPAPHLDIPAVPDHPTHSDLTDALTLLGEMTAGFPFVSEHDRANYHGLLLTPLLRLLCPPPYKLFAIGAPMPGSGKTLLATCARIIHGGIFRAEMPEDQAELRKAISTILDITTGPVIHFDNVTGYVTSSVLAGLLTSGRWEDRRLGTMEQITCPNDRVWTFTGNNLTFGGDLPRRTVWCTIDAKMPNPENRTQFAINDLEQWVTKHRGNLLAALLTLIRAWVAGGRPKPTPTRSDGFAAWAGTIAGILTHAGLPGVFDHPESARAGGIDDDGWGAFLTNVYRVFGHQEWIAAQVLDRVDRLDSASIPLDALPGTLAEQLGKGTPAGASRSLSRWLRNRVGRWADGLAVQSRGQNRLHQHIWQIIPYQVPTDKAGALTAPTAIDPELRRARPLDKPDTLPWADGSVSGLSKAMPDRPENPSQWAQSSHPPTCRACNKPLDPAFAERWQRDQLHPSCAPEDPT